jgi:hypothetical protein
MTRGDVRLRTSTGTSQSVDDELPEEAIEAAEERPAAHDHDALDDDRLLDHLRSGHRLDVPDHLSRSTLDGLHDRLHDQTDAAVQPDGG